VLFSLVLSTGIGSLASDRWPLSTNRKRLLWALGTALAIIASVFYIEGMMAALSDASLASRAILCLSLTLPLGFLMGFGFPTGMLLAGKENPGATAWFWGINGAAGVMGGGLAIAFNIGAGIDFTMFLAALCYAALVIPGVRR
jgi:hypothetical protein